MKGFPPAPSSNDTRKENELQCVVSELLGDEKDEENKKAEALQGHPAPEIRCPCDIRNMEETGPDPIHQ